MKKKEIKILLAAPRGFCAGVVRAIEIVEKVLTHGLVRVIDKSNNTVGSLSKETVSKFLNN